MKTKRFRLLTILLTAVMFVALSLNAYAAESDAVTQDGLTAQLFTDKDSYQTNEEVNATVRVDNHTGKEVFISTSLNVPEGVKLASGSTSYEAVLQNGETWTTAEGITLPASGAAGSAAATGDDVQVGFWGVLTALAVLGIIALIVFGKNKKTWLSVLLCMAMVGGLVTAAVPVQAADISGSIEVNCIIQIDGEDAAVSATVSYVIYDDADEAAEESTDSGSKEESTDSGSEEESTDSSSEEESTDSGSEEESTDSGCGDESNDSGSDNESSDSDSNDDDNESSDDSGTSSDEENPDEDEEAADEAGYYVVWDDFTMVNAGGTSALGYSSWDSFLPTSEVASSRGGATYTDASEYASAQAQRVFNTISEDFVWEFTLKADKTLDGSTIEMRNGGTTAISFNMNGKDLELVTAEGNVTMGELSVSRFMTLKVQISPENGTYSVMIDGETVVSDEKFLAECTSLDRMFLQMSDEGTGAVTFGTVRIYMATMYVNEKFLNADNYLPSDWTVTGDISTMYMAGTQGPDYYHAVLSDGADMSKEVTYEQDGFWLEYQMLLPASGAATEVQLILEDEEGNSFVVAVKDNVFGYYNGDAFVSLYTDGCLNNLWYHIMVKDTDEGGILYLNHKEKASGIELPFVKFTRITFKPVGGSVWLDDILLKDWIPYPENYVPTPVAVEKEDGAPLVGMQSCSLWVEGTHFGYDWLTAWEDRTSVLGFYDEISAESADWELKYKVEHGIDFELYCWYRAQGGNNAPLKYNRNGNALHEGYFNAKYSNMMKFAITWECGGSPVANSADFRENVVPYWIEQYFKDDRYQLIDNKPVVGMYNVSKLMSYFGGTIEGVKAELDYLRQACVDAGFDGCYIIMSNSDTASIANIEAAGFDGQYAYSWGLGCGDIEVQKTAMTAFAEAAREGEADMIPVASMGRDDSAWDRNSGTYTAPEDFETLLEWIEEKLRPTLDKDSLGAEMVLMDNWNEYGEGHFIMPAGLHGFGYVDAIGNVYGDGEGHEDIVPTGRQLERINHMFVQDRVVEKIKEDKEEDLNDFVCMEGFFFEEDGNTEGWTVGQWKGENLDVENLRVENGSLKGNTYMGNAAYADPALQSPVLSLSADEITYLHVRMKADVAQSNVEFYFATDTSSSYGESKCVRALYQESNADEEGFVDLYFDMSGNSYWTGTVTSMRLDPLVIAGAFEIDCIEFLGRKGTGDATIYLNEEKIYNAEPVRMINETILFPLEEIGLLGACIWEERMDGSGIEMLFLNEFTIKMDYDSGKMVANGEEIELKQGLTVINDIVYVPIEEMFKVSNEYLIEWQENEKELHIRLDEPEEEPYIVKAWYFTDSNEKWAYGGSNYVSGSYKHDQVEGTISQSANGSDAKIWSYGGNDTSNYINVPFADITHLRLKVKTTSTAENPVLKVQFTADNIKNTVKEISVTYTEGEDGWADVLIDLKEIDFTGYTTLDRLCIWYWNGADATETLTIDCVELINADCDAAWKTQREWQFVDDNEKWKCGGKNLISTSCQHNPADNTISLTANGADAKFWTSDNASLLINIPIEEFDRIVMRVKTSAETDNPVMKLQFVTDKGSNFITENISYTQGEDGWAIVVIDRKDLVLGESTLVKRMGIHFYNGVIASGEETMTIDWVEFQKKDISCKDTDGTQTPDDSDTSEEPASPEEPDEPDTPEKPETPQDPDTPDFSSLSVLREWKFENSTEGMTPGGSTSLAQKDGALVVTAASDGQPRLWTAKNYTEGTAGLAGIPAADAWYIRINLKQSGVASAKFKLRVQMTDKTLIDYYVEYQASEEYIELLFCLEDNPSWDETKTIARLGLFPFDEKSNNAQAGKVIYVDAIEILGTTGVGERPEVPSGDNGVNEVAGSEYEVQFRSAYFKSGNENWSGNGSTAVSASDGALKVTTGADGMPGLMSSSGTTVQNGEGNSRTIIAYPMEIASEDVDYIRIRIRTAVDDKDMTVVLNYVNSQGTTINKEVAGISYTAVTDGWSEALVDVRAFQSDTVGMTMDRIELYPFGTESTSYSYEELYIGSVEYLKTADAGAEEPLKVLIIGNSITQHTPSVPKGWIANWGMAATSREKDYVHLLNTLAVAENQDVEMHWVNISEYEMYFYDWSKVTNDYSAYVDFDADIIIATFGANIKNSANEGDSSYENDQTFNPEKYKAIIDHFNPGNDAKVIAGATPLTLDSTVAIIEEAAETYSYTYVDMTGITGQDYTAAKYAEQLQTLFGVSEITSGVLGHPGDDGMQSMADALWISLKEMIKEKP